MKKRYSNEDFTTKSVFELEKEFNTYSNISFISCIFNHELEPDTKLNLRFSGCTFKGVWKHIICEEIAYSKCTFDKFVYDNISKEKVISKDSTLFDCTFNEIDCEGVIFKTKFIQIIDERKKKHINRIRLIRCEFEEEFILNVTDGNDKNTFREILFQKIDLSDSVFHSKFKMQECTISEKANFSNTKFKKLADFYRTTFNEVDFEKADFEDVAVFSETTFKEDIDFKYTKFLGYSIFRDTVIEKKLNLRNTIFDSSASANFLDITKVERDRSEEDKDEFIGETTPIEVSNRETARVIKDFYDKSSNIIEANKFYALEMEQMKKELSISKNFLQWLIFQMHSISSDHSQSWYLSLVWILIFGFISTLIQAPDINLNIEVNRFTSIALVTVILLFSISNIKKQKFYILSSIFFYMLYIVVIAWNENFGTFFLNAVNPLSKPTCMSLDIFFFKIIIAYLIYQFIVSVRQNTRRK